MLVPGRVQVVQMGGGDLPPECQRDQTAGSGPAVKSGLVHQARSSAFELHLPAGDQIGRYSALGRVRTVEEQIETCVDECNGGKFDERVAEYLLRSSLRAMTTLQYSGFCTIS